MKLLTIFITLLCFASFTTACSEDDNYINSQCSNEVIVSSELYDTAPNDNLNILETEIKDNCLIIKFGSSGCNGDSWEIKLIDSEMIMESYPPQRNIRLSLKNEELCDAYFTKELSFDIRSLQVEGDKVYLNITNSEEQILYEY